MKSRSLSIIIWSLVLYMILGFAVMNPVHELGHSLICQSEGYQSQTWYDLRGGHEMCSGVPSNAFLYDAAGGLVQLVPSLVMVTLGLTVLKRYRAVLVVGLAYVVDSVLVLILEGFFTNVYSRHGFDVVITAIQLGSLGVFSLYYAGLMKDLKVSKVQNHL